MIDRPGDVDFVRGRIARLGGGLVVRADPHPIVRFALEVEPAATVDHQR